MAQSLISFMDKYAKKLMVSNIFTPKLARSLFPTFLDQAMCPHRVK